MQTMAHQRRNIGNTVIDINPNTQLEIANNYSWSGYAKVGLAIMGTLAGTTMLANKTGHLPSSLPNNDEATPGNTLRNSYQLINPQDAITFADNRNSIQPRHAKRAGVGVEFQINTYITGYQEYPSIATLNSGDFVVVWQSNGQDGDGYGIYSQRFSSTGAPQGVEFQINTYITGNQEYPSIATLNSGDFVVVWQSNGQDGDSYGIYGQRFSSTGVAQGVEFQINTYITGNQECPSIATLDSGDFVVVWQSNGQDGDSYGIYGQRFSSTGVAQGGEFQINTYTTSDQIRSVVAALNTGDFVVVWQSGCLSCIGQDGDEWGIYGQRFSNTGVLQGNEFQVNTYTTSWQSFPALAALTMGDFVATWQSGGQDGDGAGAGIYAQRFSSTGTPQGGEFQINTYTANYQLQPSVAALNSDDFVVVWQSGFDTNVGRGRYIPSYDIYGQRYSSMGVPKGSEFQISTYTMPETRYTKASQRRPAVAALNSDDFVVTWASNWQDGSNYGVYGSLFLKNAIPPKLINNALAIEKAAAVILRILNLSAYDIDSGASELTFIISNMQYGQFEHVSNAGITITNFTLQEIIDGAIQFVHDGSKNQPAYDVSVNDELKTSPSESAAIVFVAQNQLVTKPGDATILSPKQLAIQSQLASTVLEISLSNIRYGRFEKNIVPGVAISSFMISELDTGSIQFIHSGTENAPQFTMRFKEITANYTFSPQIVGNTLLNHQPIVLNPTGTLNWPLDTFSNYTIPGITFSDPDGDSLQLSVLALNDAPLPTWVKFDNVTNTLSGTPAASGLHDFKIIAIDPYNENIDDRFSINVRSAGNTPSLTANALTVLEGQTVILTSSNLSADDPDDDNNTLLFTVSNMQNSQFEKAANPGASITSFTQLEVINGEIQFVHDGNENAPYYEVSVSDATTASTNDAAAIIFINVNDAPVLNNYNMLITSPGQSMTLNGDYLSATDSDSDDTTLIFTISSEQHCRFELITSPGTPITSFTQQQLQNGNIQFVHTQVASLPTFQVSVSDGTLSTTPVDAMTFQIINNQLVVESGKAVPITLNNINVLTQQLATDTMIIVTNVANGYFMQTTNPGQSINNFSLQQIKDGEISFVKDNKDNLPSYDVRLSYTNATQLTPVATPDITLNHPPVVATKIQDQQASKAKPFDFTISENTFSDPDGDPLTVSLEMQDGTQKPTWLQFEPNYSTNRHRFFGRPSTPGGIPLRVVARDTYNASANADFLLQVMGNITNIVNEGTNPFPIVAAIAGGAALLACAVAGGIVYFKKAQDRKTRQQHKFAQLIRRHLGLQKVDNFDSEDGQRFIQAVAALSGLLQEEQGIDITTMDENRLSGLASSIAVSAKNKITPDITKLWKKSKITITDFEDNIEQIARDNRLDDISYAKVSDDVHIPMNTM